MKYNQKQNTINGLNIIDIIDIVYAALACNDGVTTFHN